VKDEILGLAYEVSKVTEEKIGLIDGVMRQAGLLAMNARIEAARAGVAGAAFGVVAQEMSNLTNAIRLTSQELRGAIADNIARLQEAGSSMVTDFRGERYSDLAHNAIEIIDRNLYERSCDVRWWATDSAVVEAATEADERTCAFATDRLATILRSYTVYLDLWIADRAGRIIATGRPDAYPGAPGSSARGEPWFEHAVGLASGEDFTVADIAAQPTLGGAATATYSTAIRAGGATKGRVIGALGIFFDWAPQAATVVKNLGLSAEEQAACRVMLVDARHRIIAASDDQGLLTETYPLKTEGRTRGFYRQGDRLIAFALTPGYETYKGLGWFGVVEWRMSA
jgi:hypothetical protein